MYGNPSGIPYFHPDLNMPPQKAAKVLMGAARSPKGKAKGKGKIKASGKLPARMSGGARVFGGKK